MATETVYRTYDNEIKLLLTEDGSAYTSLASATNIKIRFNSTTYSGTATDMGMGVGEEFDIETSGSEGYLILRLGGVLPAGRDQKTEVIVYHDDFPNGIVWDTIDLKVVDI